MTHRSGFASLVGRPNAGKSTLTNALVGAKVAITSSKPQTTRHAIRGLVQRDDAQLIIVDTPGLHKPKTLLGERLNAVVRETLAEVDAVGFCVPADQPVGPGDKFPGRRALTAQEPGAGTRHQVRHGGEGPAGSPAAGRQPARRLGRDRAGQRGDRMAGRSVADLFVARLPEGPNLYPEGELTDEPEQTLIAELIREAALEGVRDELPHSIAVLVEEMVPREGRTDGLIDIYATIYVERDSQKPIVLGKGGARMKDIGTRSRTAIVTAAGEPGLSRSSREGRQGVAARPQAAAPARFLTAEPRA